MIHASLLAPGAPEWDRVLGSYPHDFHHEPGYAALCGIHERGAPRALYVEEAGRRMLLPLLLRDGLDGVSPYGYPGPIGDADFFTDALGAGLEHARSEGLVSIFVRLHPLLNAIPPTGVGTLVHHGETVSIDLRLSDEAMWSRTRADHRNQINRAIRLGHTASIDAAFARYHEFQELYRRTMRRVGAADYYLFDESYFDALRAALGDRLHLCVVEIDGTFAGGGLFVETDGLVQYHLSGTAEASVRDRPTKLMLHFARGWARERGNTRLHLGGGVGGAHDSLFDFKAGFSPDRHPYHTLRLVADPPRYAELVRARDPLADVTDLRGYFPGYRVPA